MKIIVYVIGYLPCAHATPLAPQAGVRVSLDLGDRVYAFLGEFTHASTCEKKSFLFPTEKMIENFQSERIASQHLGNYLISLELSVF